MTAWSTPHPRIDQVSTAMAWLIMAEELKIAPELHARIDAIAMRSSRSAAEVVADALEHGHSLEWQERFLDKVKAGIEAAEAGRFASSADVERVLAKYRPS